MTVMFGCSSLLDLVSDRSDFLVLIFLVHSWVDFLSSCIFCLVTYTYIESQSFANLLILTNKTTEIIMENDKGSFIIIRIFMKDDQSSFIVINTLD